MQFTRNPLELGMYVLCAAVLIAVAVQAFQDRSLPSRTNVPPPPISGEPCIGDPIFVDYPFDGGMMGPHECIVQCHDGIPRFIQYKDGRATQCEEPPGCNDWGEDHGATCVPPGTNENLE